MAEVGPAAAVVEGNQARIDRVELAGQTLLAAQGATARCSRLMARPWERMAWCSLFTLKAPPAWASRSAPAPINHPSSRLIQGCHKRSKPELTNRSPSSYQAPEESRYPAG